MGHGLRSTHLPGPQRRPIGVGIVGLSARRGFAATAHVPALRALDGYELRALSASSAESAAAAGRTHDVPLTFASAEELARCPEVDLVVITVRVPLHHQLVGAALDAGKMVLCEWPLGNGLAEAEDLARRARERAVRTAVGLQARSAPGVRYVADLIADGYVGEVLSTTLVGSGGSWGAEIPDAASRYLADRANGATMLTIPLGHTLDGVALALGELEPVTAMVATRRTRVRDAETGEAVEMTAPDQVAVAGRLPGGAVAAIHYRGGQSRATNFRWEINGTEGDLVLTGPTGHLQFGHVAIHGSRGQDESLRPLTVPDSYHRVPELSDQRSASSYVVAHAYAQLLEDLETGSSVVPDFEHAVRRHRTLATIETIAASGAGKASDASPG